MPTTVTWDDGVNPPTVFTFSDAVLASLEAFRLETTVVTGGELVPAYPTVISMAVGLISKYYVLPALAAHPTAALATARASIATAMAAQAQVLAAELPGFVPPIDA